MVLTNANNISNFIEVFLSNGFAVDRLHQQTEMFWAF